MGGSRINTGALIGVSLGGFWGPRSVGANKEIGTVKQYVLGNLGQYRGS